MKMLSLGAFALAMLAAPVLADEPDGLKLPAGFHATVIADGLIGMRHIAVRDNGDIYLSTQPARGLPSQGIIALHLDAGGRVDKTEHFSTVDGGTGIRFYDGALYATSQTAIYRFAFNGDSLTPAGEPQTVVDGMPPGGHPNRIIAFDGKGGLYVALGAVGENCADPNIPKGAKPVGLKPCPSLATRGGVWRFDARKTGQKFPVDGTRLATGLRDIDAFDWRPGDGLYGIMHDRNGTSAAWPELVSPADEEAIAEEMHRVTKGVDFGWPYTYYDGVRDVRLTAPEYGGDGKAHAKPGIYDTPVVAFYGHAAPLDMAFYTAKQFPKEYRGGAFVAFHGGNGPAIPGGHKGYNIVFVSFASPGHANGWTTFADGFAGLTSDSRNVATANYRPVGLGLSPDGALYVADSQKGRLWRISYSGK